MTRLIVAAFGLGTLSVGIGELATTTLRSYAAATPGNALFVSLSVGLVLGAASPWRRRAWPSWASVLLVAVVIAWPVLGAMRWGGFVLGVVLGALPLQLGRALPTGRGGDDARSSLATGSALGLLVLATLLSFAEPFALALLVPLVPIVWRLSRRERAGIEWAQLLLPAIALLAAVALGWLALTIAGDPLVRLAGYFTAAPVSPAAERWLGLLALVMLVALLAPWPLHRLGTGALLGPAAAVLAWRLAGSLAPDLLTAWQPLLGMVLVPSALVAAWRGRWSVALATAALVVALRPGPLALVGVALAIASVVAVAATGPSRNLLRPDRVTFSGAWWLAMLAAAGIAASAVALLQHEVVLATLLAGGLGSAAARTARATPSA